MSIKGYRADIDGLRAVAVLCVLFFHLDIGLFASGFIGVDVFFTISGFLITGIVLKECHKGNFSFGRFYIRRALRLLPAYLFLLIAVIVFAVIIMPPIAFDNMLQSAIASSFFVSNFYFLFQQGGYFSTSATELPLLHTWSLSVEEQFYLLMPLALVLWIKYCPKKYQLSVLLFFLIFSVAFSYWLTGFHQKVAYFFVLSRAHEFLLGSVVAVAIFQFHEKVKPTIFIANVIFVISLVVLCLSAMVITNKANFPGLLALIPCMATCGIIYSGLNKRCISHKVLGIRPLVFIGLLSYSLYLWHWPIISLVKYIGIELTLYVQLLIALFSFSAAYVSWRFIETKVRYSEFGNKKSLAAVLYFVPSLALLAFYFQAKANDFYPERFEPATVLIEKAVKSTPESGRGVCHSSTLTINAPECVLGKLNDFDTTGMLWGDSHANHFVGFIDEYAKKNNMFIRDATMGNCPPTPNVYINAVGAKATCKSKNAAVLEYILSEEPDVVFLAASWGGYLGENTLEGNNINERVELLSSSLKDVISTLLDRDIKVIIFKTVPRSDSDLSGCFLKATMYPNFNSIDKCQFVINQKNKTNEDLLYSKLDQQFGDDISFISVDKAFCKDDKCSSYLNETPLYRDTNHLNLEASKLLGNSY